MPKIAYKIGIEPQQEVTKEWIQEKLNAAKALMQGRIDEENLCGNNTKQLLKTVKDRPTEVVAYDNCMKFFQRVGTPDEQSLGDHTPVVDLFAMLVNLCKASPDVAVVGGTLDSEMSATFTKEEGSLSDEEIKQGATGESYLLKKELEIPQNYIPMTWGELADLMIASGFSPKNIYLSDKGFLSLSNDDKAETKNEILKRFGVSSDTIVETMNYWRDGDSTKVDVNMLFASKDTTEVWGHDVEAPIIQVQCPFPVADLNLEKNVIEYNTTVKFEVNLKRVEPSDNVKDLEYLKQGGFATVKLVPEILCKVV